MDLKLLKDLRRRMTKEPRIEDVWEFFLDHFVESEEFMRLGGPMTDMHHPVLAVVAKAADAVFARCAIPAKIKDAIVLDDCVLIHVPEYGIIHGTMFLEGRLASLLYLEDIQIGAMYIFIRSNHSEYARFTLTRAPSASTRRN